MMKEEEEDGLGEGRYLGRAGIRAGKRGVDGVEWLRMGWYKRTLSAVDLCRDPIETANGTDLAHPLRDARGRRQLSQRARVFHAAIPGGLCFWSNLLIARGHL